VGKLASEDYVAGRTQFVSTQTKSATRPCPRLDFFGIDFPDYWAYTYREMDIFSCEQARGPVGDSVKLDSFNSSQPPSAPFNQLAPTASRHTIKVVLISTYELGRQPFGLASAAAWLRQVGADVTCLDLSREKLDAAIVRSAHLVAFYVPMHTATRIAVRVVKIVRELNPSAELCAYGLYAPMNAEYLQEVGFNTILGGEFEAGLAALVQRIGDGHQQKSLSEISLERQQFLVPDRSDLPLLSNYAQLLMPDGSRRTVGYTEASRGCKHLCRHCPIVPVYGGKFRIVQRDVVMADIRRQVEAEAQHITFGDPDFFNGVGHAIALVREFHQEFPELTYDVTIKVEHLLKHAEQLPLLLNTGCAFVTSAVESVDDRILHYFDKCHTRADFITVVDLFKKLGLVLSPTFVTFTPWTTLEGYGDLLSTLDMLDLVPNVAPIQYAIRLLIPAGSRLLELKEVQDLIGNFDPESLSYPWKNPDPRMDALHTDLQEIIGKQVSGELDREGFFSEVVENVRLAGGGVTRRATSTTADRHGAAIPHMNEPWYCCAEPTEEQIAPF
jgi:radical SAM superfamily enzyme YgiQ (UPF0313 family)